MYEESHTSDTSNFLNAIKFQAMSQIRYNMVFFDLQKGLLFEFSEAFRPYHVLENNLIHSDSVQLELELTAKVYMRIFLY